MLILTEKPSVAKDFATALECQFRSGFYSNGHTDITNCIGHLFRLQEPEYYDIKYKSWNEIPCIPQRFAYTVNDSVKPQAALVIKLLRDHHSDTILIATDADREGEVIARECLEQAGITDFSHIKRFWVSQALTPEVVLQGIKDAKPITEYNHLALNGFGRQHTDWLTGYNFTRYVSIAANKKLSIGRVKTAVLSAIDTRCSQIANFKSEKYFEYYGIFGAQRCAPACKGIFFTNCEKTEFKDNTFENILNDDIGRKVLLSENTSEKKETPAPQLYNLNAVQKDAFLQYSLSAEDTLAVIQKLYEEYKCVSYPRTPSKVMGSGNVELVKNIFSDLSKTYPDLNEILKISDISLSNKRCFNDAKLEAHHALIPLRSCPEKANEIEKKVYSLIFNRFKIAFAAPCIYQKKTIILSVNNHKYRINGKRIIDNGWKTFETSATLRSEEDADNQNIEQSLENIDWNNLILQSVEKKEKWTKSPKYYNEASILSFMENPKSQEEDQKLVGLGTQATRHTFVPDLKANGYIKIENKNIIITPLGRTVIEAVRNSTIKSFADIAQTTDWEKRLEDNPACFEDEMKRFISTAVQESFKIQMPQDDQSILCPLCKKPMRFGKTKNGYGNWYCTGYKDGCTFKIWEKFNNTKLSENDISLLCLRKKTPLKRFVSKAGKEYKAKLFLNSKNEIEIEFEKR